MKNYTVTVQNPIPFLLATLAFVCIAGMFILGFAAAGNVATQMVVFSDTSPTQAELVAGFGGPEVPYTVE